VLIDNLAGDRPGGDIGPEPPGQLVAQGSAMHPQPRRPQSVACR